MVKYCAIFKILASNILYDVASQYNIIVTMGLSIAAFTIKHDNTFYYVRIVLKLALNTLLCK